MKRVGIVIALLALTAGNVYSQNRESDGRQFIGAWTGTWEGDGSGKFELNFVTQDDEPVECSITSGLSVGEYTVKFETLSFSGRKFTGRYEYPLDAQGEIVIDGELTSAGLSGTWKLVQKGGNDAASSGTWNVTKR